MLRNCAPENQIKKRLRYSCILDPRFPRHCSECCLCLAHSLCHQTNQFVGKRLPEALPAMLQAGFQLSEILADWIAESHPLGWFSFRKT